MLAHYLRSLYADAMQRAYDKAYGLIGDGLGRDPRVLDCGASQGGVYQRLAYLGLPPDRYRGIEWDPRLAAEGRRAGREIIQGDLNRPLPFGDGEFSCVFALSVLEHLLRPCLFLKECRRVLRPGGRLVLLTPNISTPFTIALLLAGRMPSSGPHPDSNELQRHTALFGPTGGAAEADVEMDNPVHRHLIVFSYRVLRDYLRLLGMEDVRGYGFGWYPFPRWLQPAMERADPWHCHQMVFVARTPH